MAPRWPLAGLLDAVVALAMFCPGTLTVGALLEAMSAVLVRGVGLAWVTAPAGIVATTIPPRHELAVKPEQAERERRGRTEARTTAGSSGAPTEKVRTRFAGSGGQLGR